MDTVSWISCGQVNHEIRYSTNYQFSYALYTDFDKTIKLNIYEKVSFPYSTKGGTKK